MQILSWHRKPMNYILSRICRYPTIFKLFTTPTPHLPMNAATKSLSTLCVRMKSAASTFAMQELNLKSDKLATKLQKLPMLSSHRMLLTGSHWSGFWKEFALPNKLRALIVRHPELFYVSQKGTLLIRERLIDLVQEGNRIRRERTRKGAEYSNDDNRDAGIDKTILCSLLSLHGCYKYNKGAAGDGVDSTDAIAIDSGVEYFSEEDDEEAWVSSGESVEYWSRKLSSSGMSNDRSKECVIESW
ncbi:hypothetical protein HID58_022920 [Brassica napus]|uniref:PORR domain-containing protein n=1 Tax=Brassica napus TaxID=3708 RepID=A0ABQ8D0L7_BRANA|nr:hypothetical protein HID58_022920 [Brassica napus]